MHVMEPTEVYSHTDSPTVWCKLEQPQRKSYEKDFRLKFVESKGDAFQRLFEELMLKVHPNDFMACCPWGRHGDRKNDGYLKSERTLFQVYAPNEMRAAVAIKKIKEDFYGAIPYWQEHFDKWVFVHNAPGERLPPAIIREISRLQDDNPQIKIEPWGYQALLNKFREVSLSDLESWYGPSLTSSAMINLGYQDIQGVLEHIRTALIPMTDEVKQVSPGKIQANLLSPAVADFLKMGMQKSPLVGEFFDHWHNPVYAEQIAGAFKKKYIELRETSSLHPDAIFGKLEAWAGGTYETHPNHKAAVLAVLAYFFDKCEIFEDAQLRGRS